MCAFNSVEFRIEEVMRTIHNEIDPKEWGEDMQTVLGESFDVISSAYAYIRRLGVAISGKAPEENITKDIQTTTESIREEWSNGRFMQERENWKDR